MGQRLSRTTAVATNTFREAVRERVLHGLVILAILTAFAGLALRPLSIRQDAKIVADLGLAAMELFGTLIALVAGASLVSKEVERRSLDPLLAKPLSRGEFYFGKFVGLAITLLVSVVIMTLGTFVSLHLAGGGSEIGLLKAAIPIYASLVLVVALGTFFSTLTSPTLSTLFTVCLAVAGRFSDVIRHAHDVLPSIPARLARGIALALPNFSNFDFKSRVAHGDVVPWADVGAVVLYGACYAALMLTLGLLFFRRKDLA